VDNVAEGRRGNGQRGQVLVIFTLSAVAIIAAVGLVIDGGWTSVQRRDQQNVADVAAMAGGYAYVNSGYDASQVQSQARATTAVNGYTDGQNGVSVNVSVSGADITVSITKPHRNYFSGIVGFPQWDVSTTATVEAGVPNSAVGVMPIIFNQKAIASHGYNSPSEFAFGEPSSGNEAVPQDANSFNWTVYCVASGNGCNADSQTVNTLIDTRNQNPQDVTLDMLVSPLNAGSHATLYSSMATYITQDFPVGIVDDNGNFKGLAMFHLTASQGGSVKTISGWFESPVNSAAFHITPGVGAGFAAFGTYVVKLTN